MLEHQKKLKFTEQAAEEVKVPPKEGSPDSSGSTTAVPLKLRHLNLWNHLRGPRQRKKERVPHPERDRG